MNEEIKNLLDEEIKSQIQRISSMDVEDQNYSALVNSLVKLHSMRIEEAKLISEKSDRDYKRKTDEEDRQYKRDFEREERKYRRDAEEEDRQYKRGFEKEERDYRRNTELADRQYKRDFEREERDYKRSEDVIARNHERQQSEEQRTERFIRIGLDVAGLLIPIAFYSTWMRKGFKFEETGTFTSTTFRNLFGHFKPTKR